MSNARRILGRKNLATQKLTELLTAPHFMKVIHYSCESFFDMPNGSSSRITSIAVRNMETGQTKSFSIHQVAERFGIEFDTIDVNYGELERRMLDEFFEYVGAHLKDYKWLHWNMRNINYGFQALVHRYEVLGGEPVLPPEENLYDLSIIFLRLFGERYIGNPKMHKLAEKNDLLSHKFLIGADEAVAFEKGEYVKLHQSTLTKVDVIAKFAEKAWNDTLKTNMTWKDEYGTGVIALVESASEHWAFKVAGAIAVAFTLITGFDFLIRIINV